MSICNECWGKGWIEKQGVQFDCRKCKGTGVIENEPQTNEEWAKSLDSEHFAKLLSDAMWYGDQCDQDDVTCEECGCPWCKTDSISEWLKQPRTKE